MPNFYDFVQFVSEKSGIKTLKNIEKDILLHRILMDIYSHPTGQNYLLKGGSCLVKCYFGYYRFSLDLDFTWSEQRVWENLGKSNLSKKLHNEIRAFSQILETLCGQLNLEFQSKPEEERFFKFGGGGRMVTFKLWKGSDVVKVQVNHIERILFEQKSVTVKTLLDTCELSENEKAYFREFLDFYKPFRVNAYDEREILCEKVRAILTRKRQVLRDFYDLFVLHSHGFEVEDFENEILEKIKSGLYYKKYREALEKNMEELNISEDFLNDPSERSLFVRTPDEKFNDFLEKLVDTLKEIADKLKNVI